MEIVENHKMNTRALARPITIDRPIETDAKLEESWHIKYQSVLGDLQKVRQTNANLQAEISQQVDYSHQLGASLGKLLWRGSRSDYCVQNMLTNVQNKDELDNFLQLSANTLTSFVGAYRQSEWPTDLSTEHQFVISLCGTLANFAASPTGREWFLSNKYRDKMIRACIKGLRDSPAIKSAKLKSLLLMILYNLTISQPGLVHLSTTTGLIQILVSLLHKEKDTENVLTLHLLLSLVSQDNNATLVQELREQISSNLISTLSTSENVDIRKLTQAVLSESHLDT